jgi:hypothetical protein
LWATGKFFLKWDFGERTKSKENKIIFDAICQNIFNHMTGGFFRHALPFFPWYMSGYRFHHN